MSAALPPLPEPKGKIFFEPRPYEDGWVSSSDAFDDDQMQAYATAALAELERTHYTAEDVADASAQGFRDGVASVTAGQEPVMFAYQYEDGTWHDASATEHSKGMKPLFAAPVAQQPQAERKDRLEAALSTVFGWKQPQAEAPTIAQNKAAPVASWNDSRTQKVYEVLTNDNYPPKGSEEHWEGWKARLVVSFGALFPEQPQAEAVPRQVTEREHNVLMRALARSGKKVEAPPQAEAVRMPTSADEAELMQKAGLAWLKQYAPERLTPQQAEAVPELTGCNCRWRGGEVVSRCELHEAWHVAIHEWAERAKAAEAKQVEAVPRDVVRDANIEAAAKKMAEIFDYRWDFMPEKFRNTMRENVRAVLDAALAASPKGQP